MVLLPTLAFLHVMLKAPTPVEVDTSLQNRTSLSFLLLGDQGTGNLRQWQVADGMHLEAARSPVDAVFLMGDSFYPHGVTSVDDWQWRYKFENVYREALSQTPFFATFGNHDYYGSETPLIEYATDNIGSGRWQFPARDYLTVLGGTPNAPLVRVAFIDTGLVLRDANNAVRSLDRLLSGPKARWTVLVTHKPLTSGNSFDHRPGARALWLEVLNRHQVNLIISGHDHNMQFISPEDAPLQVIQGAGGKYGQPLTNPDLDGLEFYSALQGFSRLDVSNEQLVIRYFNRLAEPLFERQVLEPEINVSQVTN